MTIQKSQNTAWAKTAKKAFAAAALVAATGLSGCVNLPMDTDTKNIEDFGNTPAERQAFFDKVDQAKAMTGQPLEAVLKVLEMERSDFSKQGVSEATRVALYIEIESIQDLEEADRVADRMQNIEVLKREFEDMQSRDSIRFHRVNTRVAGEEYTLYLVVKDDVLMRIADDSDVKNERKSDSKIDDFLKNSVLP